MLRSNLAKCLACAAVCLLILGCESQDKNRPKTVPVSGTITYQGKPVDGAHISLTPVAPDGRSAYADTDANGQFKLATLEPGDGAMPGDYKVAIHKRVEGKDLLPAQYGNADTSGLTLTVPPGGKSDANFALQ